MFEASSFRDLIASRPQATKKLPARPIKASQCSDRAS
jgi:hypothetical protein